MYVQIALQARQTTWMDEPTHPQQVAPMVAATVDEGIRLLATKTVADFPKNFRLQKLHTFCVGFTRWWILDMGFNGSDSINYWLIIKSKLAGLDLFHPFSTTKKWAERDMGHQYDYKTQVQWFSQFLQYLSNGSRNTNPNRSAKIQQLG